MLITVSVDAIDEAGSMIAGYVGEYLAVLIRLFQNYCYSTCASRAIKFSPFTRYTAMRFCL
jgi:hypothetical protein